MKRAAIALPMIVAGFLIAPHRGGFGAFGGMLAILGIVLLLRAILVPKPTAELHA